MVDVTEADDARGFFAIELLTFETSSSPLECGQCLWSCANMCRVSGLRVVDDCTTAPGSPPNRQYHRSAERG